MFLVQQLVLSFDLHILGLELLILGKNNTRCSTAIQQIFSQPVLKWQVSRFVDQFIYQGDGVLSTAIRWTSGFGTPEKDKTTGCGMCRSASAFTLLRAPSHIFFSIQVFNGISFSKHPEQIRSKQSPPPQLGTKAPPLPVFVSKQLL